MGEIAEMMLNGFLDCETGEYLDGDEPGFPRTTRDVFGENHYPQRRNPRNTKCPICNRKFRGVIGLMDHVRVMHEPAKDATL